MKPDFRIPAALGFAVFLTACASTPEPEPVPVVEEVVQAPAQPQVVEPYRPPVVTQQEALPAPGSEADFVRSAGGDARVYFGYDQHTLTQDARNALRQQAEWLNRYSQYNAVVEGHADERGTRQYNLALGARRANSVKAYLVSQGVAPSRLTTVSYGKERPIDARSNEAGWARNRNGYTNLRSVGES